MSEEPGTNGRIRVEVIAAWPDVQPMVSLILDAGSCVRDAIRMSGLAEKYPELEIRPDRIGIFGELCSPDRVLVDGDRVELYRALLADPKEARRQKAVSASGSAAGRPDSARPGSDRRRD